MIAVRGRPGDAPISNEELRRLDEMHGPTGAETSVIGTMLQARLIRESEASRHPREAEAPASRASSSENRVGTEIIRRLKEAGLQVDLVVVSYDSSQGEIPAGFTASYSGDVSFDVLVKISLLFGTRNINLSCDTGTGSDRCHEREIYVRDISKLWESIEL